MKLWLCSSENELPKRISSLASVRYQLEKNIEL